MPKDRHKTFSDRQSEAARAKKLEVTKKTAQPRGNRRAKGGATTPKP